MQLRRPDLYFIEAKIKPANFKNNGKCAEQTLSMMQ